MKILTILLLLPLTLLAHPADTNNPTADDNEDDGQDSTSLSPSTLQRCVASLHLAPGYANFDTAFSLYSQILGRVPAMVTAPEADFASDQGDIILGLDACGTYLTTSIMQTTANDGLMWRKGALLAEAATLKLAVSGTGAAVGSLTTSHPSLGPLLPYLDKVISLGGRLTDYVGGWMKWLLGLDKPISAVEKIGEHKQDTEGWLERMCSLMPPEDDS